MFREISSKSFYGKNKEYVKILNSVQNPNESDLEEIDIEDFEFSDENVMLTICLIVSQAIVRMI
jgi:hypothetical protein